MFGRLDGARRPIPDAFLRETRELMLRRARVAIVLGTCILVAFIAVDEMRIAPWNLPLAIALRASGGATLVALYAVTRLPGAVRWSHPIGAGALAILMSTVAAIMPLFDGVTDPDYAIQGTGLVLCVLGAGSLLPFDGAAMLGLGLLGLAFHVGFTLHFPLEQNLPILAATFAAIPIAVVAAREITRSRLADYEGRRAKEDLLRAREDFVAMLTHDIRNPLAVIRGYAEELRAEPDLAADERDRMLASIERASGIALALAANVLDASKIEAGRFSLKKCPISIAEVLRQAVAEQLPIAEQKGVRLTDECAAELPMIAADPAALARVVTNLVGNAIKHTPSGGAVLAAARVSAPREIEIVVEDTGDGLPPGEETGLFDRYTSATTRADSTGLGLFISKTITVAHGGAIVAENREDGRGARFRVTLPLD